MALRDLPGRLTTGAYNAPGRPALAGDPMTGLEPTHGEFIAAAIA
jgi:hypothetical protein